MPTINPYTISPADYRSDFTTQENQGVVYVTSNLLAEAAGLLHVFTTRHGGVSQGPQASLNLDHKKDSNANVRENHLRLAAALGYAPEAMVSTHQIHSDVIREAQAADAGLHLDGPTPYECDALVTNQPGRPLIAYAADCIPILLYAPATANNQAAVAAVHAGWRGTQQDIAAKTVQRMQQLDGINPADRLAAIGPGIDLCCFSTHADVLQAMQQAFGPEVQAFSQPDATAEKNGEPGKFLVNLKAINAWRLQTAGLRPANIAISPECTCCLPEKYWSHRFTKGERGGQAAVISLLS